MRMRSIVLIGAAAACWSSLPGRARAEPEAAGTAEAVIAGFAARAESARSLAARPAAAPRAASTDVPGIRETVRRLTVLVERTCAGGVPRYALKPVSDALGPALGARADSLESAYLYPREAGLRLGLSGDGAGAELSIGPERGPERVVGTIAPEAAPCRPYPEVEAVVDLAPDAAAALSVGPRTGIFRPACYKDPINGFYKLDTWTILTLAFPQETMTVRTRDGKSFRDEGECRAYYARLTAAGG